MAPTPSNETIASREIEETLRLARDGVERQIARYRVWLFATVAVSTIVVRALNPNLRGPVTVPTVYFAACTLYALLLERIVHRVGAREAIVYVALGFDSLAISCISPIMAHVGAAEESVTFGVHLTAPGLALVSFVNILRGDRRSCIVAAGISSVLVTAVLWSLEGFQPAQIGLATGFWVLGAVGVASAEQGKRNLQNFARLQLLRRYLSPAAVERVMRGDPDAALALGGRLVTVTLLSADLRGFTAMSEALSPGEVVRQLNAFHGAMLEQIDRNGGLLDKFIGDGILAVFGLEPGSADAGARAAVACGKGMLVALARHNEERERGGEPPLKMGIGVHTGPVVAGNIGAPGRRLEFTVIGDAVNTASRLEGLTKEAGTPLLVSGPTVEHIGDDSELTERAPVTVRGKVSPMRVYSA